MKPSAINLYVDTAAENGYGKNAEYVTFVISLSVIMVFSVQGISGGEGR